MENNWKLSKSDWLNKDLPSYLKEEIKNNSDEKNQDAFYTEIDFGTAGMRGLMGAGTNRINIYTIRKTTEALAKLITEQNRKDDGVVISYDSRNNSKEFALETAKILRSHNIKTYLFTGPRPTPELSFAVRELNTFSGVMITASHNPREYNGYKLYGEDGGQLSPINASKITTLRDSIENPFKLEGTETGINYIDEEIDTKYLDNIKKVNINKEVIDKQAESLKITFTPLHGASGLIAEKALNNLGIRNVNFVDEQFNPDGNFPTVKKPNPEDPAVFGIAKQTGDDLLIAIDPDGDRLGAGIKLENGDYQFLTGNQIATLLVNYLIIAKKETNEMSDNFALVTSNVSSTLPEQIVKKNNVKTFYVHTGFKFIAEKIEEFNRDNNYKFLFGFEESYGYLIKDFVRDKDAIQVLVMFVEMLSYFKNDGKNLPQVLNDIYKEFGFYVEKTLSLEFDGIEGIQKITNIMNLFKENNMNSIGDLKVVKFYDFDQQISYDFKTNTTSQVNLVKANSLRFELENGSWIAVRPSGTEPKLKLYIGTNDHSESVAKDNLELIKNNLMNLINK